MIVNNSHQKLKELVKIERNTLSQILFHLKIINDQKMFVEMGYKSILHYCVKELGYSESAAYRRINALRLEKKIPVVRNLIKTGEINLTTALSFNKLLDQKQNETRSKVSDKLKKNILGEIKNKSSKEADVIVRRKLNLPSKKRKLIVEMSDESYQKWIDFKAKNVAKRMTDEMLLVHAFSKASEIKEVRQYNSRENLSLQENETLRRNVALSNGSRYISAKIKREVIKRARNTCQYKGCDSVYGLEIDHIKAFSKGGSNELSNLQLLCRNHNGFKSNSI